MDCILPDSIFLKHTKKEKQKKRKKNKQKHFDISQRPFNSLPLQADKPVLLVPVWSS